MIFTSHTTDTKHNTVVIILSILFLLYSCAPAYIEEAKESLATSINTFGLSRECDYRADDTDISTPAIIRIIKNSDTSVGFEFGSLTEEMIPCFSFTGSWYIKTNPVNLSGDFLKVSFDESVSIVITNSMSSHNYYNCNCRVKGWLHNKAITKRENPEYDIEGEITLSWQDELQKSHELYFHNIRF